ncbi:MAG: heliorhodopsin HeR [Ilumatobacteraceae bacterium]
MDASRIHRLRRWNVVAGIFHAIQGVVMLVLSSNLSLPVSATFATAQPGQPLDASRLDTLFTYRLGPAVAAFSLLSAAFHFLIASPLGFPRYERELRAERNRFRWVEYSLSASLMIVLIAGITGITDVAALIALFGVNASMILFGWLMETTSPRGAGVTWTPFVFGSIAGAVPWIAIAIYIVGAGSGTPTFVYGIFASIFVLFNCFAVNQWLQYRARGRWTDYVHGERVYIVLSFVAKTLLAWQIFVNVLV